VYLKPLPSGSTSLSIETRVRFELTYCDFAGHCVAQTDYQNGKVVFRCAKCGTYRVATASASPEAKFYILGWFMDDECSA